MSEPRFLPYGAHLVEDDDVAAVVRALTSERLTTGCAVDDFEAALAARTTARHAVVCSSGTAALHLAALALCLRPQERVIVPALTFVATASAVLLAGGEVVFADVDPDSGLMTPASLEAALTASAALPVRAVFPVHLNGQTADMAALAALARGRGLALVEDGSHALGARETVGGAPVGACRHSDMTAFSFHPVKTVAMGEGGAVTTNDAALAERLARLRNHGIMREPERFENSALAFDADGSANPWYYEVGEIGLNYRASDLHCVLGSSQLAKLERFVASRRRLARLYDELLAPLSPVVEPVARNHGCEPAWHLYAVLIDFERAGLSRGTLVRRLAAEGIGTQVHYLPLYRHPFYRRRYGALTLPGAERYYARALTLPLFVSMGRAEVERVVGALAAALGGGRA